MREYPDGSGVFRTIDAWLKENRPGVLHAIVPLSSMATPPSIRCFTVARLGLGLIAAPPRGIGFPDDLVATTA